MSLLLLLGGGRPPVYVGTGPGPRCRARLDQLVDAAGAGTSLSVEGQAL